VGGTFTARGDDFNAGSVINFFVATVNGPVNFGPLKPSSFTEKMLIVPVSPIITQGEGVVTLEVVNSTQGFIKSNSLTALLEGSAAQGLPSITGIKGIPIASDSLLPGVALANVHTVIPVNTPFSINGSGFDTINGVAVDLFCDCTDGKVGPFLIEPGDSRLSATRLTFTVPVSGMESVVVGSGSLRVSNRGRNGLYSKQSASVAAPIGARISVSKVTQSGSTLTVTGTGFAPDTVINFFNSQTSGLVNFGGLGSDGKPRLALSLNNSTEFTCIVPSGAKPGPSYVQVLNPPFVPFTSSGNAPGGAFTLH
jgi:hypothetical protein